MVRMPSVAVVLNWRNEKNKSNLYPVHIRIKLDNTARYYNVPIPLKIAKDQWSGKDDSWVKPNHPFAYEINNIIMEKKIFIYEYLKRHLNFGKPVTLEGIMGHLNSKGLSNSFMILWPTT